MVLFMNLEALKQYLESRKDVAFAFLFGSHARGTATKRSDVDIAAYFYPEKRHPVEYEEEVFYNGEHEICFEIERILKKEVELLVLNRVSASVAASAIRGIPLAINDCGLYLDFMEVITREAEDFRDMLFRDFLERREFERRTQTAVVKAS
jgi:predicted nucleotidyltransferase